MDLQLKDKKVLLTGATRGIGYGAARRFAEAGAKIWIHGSRKDNCEIAQQRLLEEFPKSSIAISPCDFDDSQAVIDWIAHLPAMDILVNNLGVYQSEDFFSMSDEWWFKHYEINVMSGVRLSRKMLPQMLENNWGRILFISSECSRLVPQDLIAYSASKAALEAISRGLAKTTRNSGVTVNSLQPGSTLTEGAVAFLENQAAQTGNTAEQVANDFFVSQRPASTLQRFAHVDEVATTIVYYCSPLAAATNGSTIAVDGGSTLGG
ncbi:MAG: SDR family NAD(P)-dependent oxidoreductase [Flavobacteriaceae bacterium]|nr:SDR family NAD(P)-dependent oxidoreductase [Flavobacteriaceae bacterium]